MGQEPRVIIDSCPIGHGIWFDGGELHQLINQMQSSQQAENQPLLSFLDDTLKADFDTK
jgi:Zn-finger nucleic acid-binding protein